MANAQPTLVSAPKPVYPKEAKDAGIGGKFAVRIVVDASGAIVSVDATGPVGICGSGGNDPRIVALRNAVVEAIKDAKFEPAMKDGQPVKAVAYLSSTFDPADSKSAPSQPGRMKVVHSGVVNGQAVSMPRPVYPRRARAERVSGAVSVRVAIDEDGKVFTAEAVSGHPLLRDAAAEAACKAKFTPTSVEGKIVRVVGLVTYNFVP